MSLKGKVAIVTGGNSGIGMAIVLELAKQGANIVIDYVCHPEATEALEKQVVALGDQAIGVQADVSKVADLRKLVDASVKNFGRVDIMVNNAGVETRTSVLDTTEEQYEKVLAINLKSAFFGIQLAAQQMIKQGGGGRIINITSVHEDWPMPGEHRLSSSGGAAVRRDKLLHSLCSAKTQAAKSWVFPNRVQGLSFVFSFQPKRKVSSISSTRA